MTSITQIFDAVARGILTAEEAADLLQDMEEREKPWWRSLPWWVDAWPLLLFIGFGCFMGAQSFLREQRCGTRYPACCERSVCTSMSSHGACMSHVLQGGDDCMLCGGGEP